MKYIALLIGLYCTILAILPCQDREDSKTEVTHVTIQKSHSGDKQCQEESCPPFCNCSCCSSARQLTVSNTSFFFTKTIVCIYPSLSVSATQSQLVNIWQPPKQA